MLNRITMGKKVREFYFKKFTVAQEGSAHKVGTDGVLLGAWASVQGARRVLDVGTGTGVIALLIAQRTDANVIIDAVELQHEEAMEAALNFKQSPWHDRLNIYEATFQDFGIGTVYDLIISNPPYFEKSWLPPDERRTTVRHTNSLSFKELAENSKRLLTNAGRLCVILPPVEAEAFRDLAANSALFCTRECLFRTRREKPVERVLMEFSLIKHGVTSEHLILYESGERWSDEYWELTKDFYLSRK
jgi:tRNA1Val (adenine37-N6)-methyltransferase